MVLLKLVVSLAQPSPQLDASRDTGNLTEGDVLKLTCTFSLFSYSQQITVGQSTTELTTDPGGVNVAGLDNVIAIAGAFDFQPQFSMEFTVNRKHDHLAVTFSQTVPTNTTFLLSSVTRTLRVKCKFSIRSLRQNSDMFICRWTAQKHIRQHCYMCERQWHWFRRVQT